jgi:single-stranded-DNA-specific exonuclease
MQKKWVLIKNVEDAKIEKLIQEFGNNKSGKQYIDKNIATLLLQRGISTFEEARTFFRPELKNLHDPFLMKDMQKAVARINEAIEKKEKIMVYGDYDVDGTTAVALVFSFLKRFHNDIEYYVPDRDTEGYGISYQSIDYSAENNFNLVIALDCGIKAVEKIIYAKEKNIDFIICDHHRPGDEIPHAIAVLDPKRKDCDYPYKELSGCGLGFKLIQAIAMEKKISFKEITPYLDLVCLSIASDIVPITGENRILAYHGLRLINTNPAPAFEILLKYSNVERKEKAEEKENQLTKEITISDLVFLVGPRVNAAGRIQQATNSVKLLLSKNLKEAKGIGEQINRFNDTRREFDKQATKEALEQIEQDKDYDKKRATVVFNKDWHKGVLGIVASRLTDHYYRPTIVFTEAGEMITGSARSVKNFDVYDAIDSCSHLLEHFGGHKYAAGLTLKKEKMEEFMQCFEKYVQENIEEDMLVPEVEVDLEISLNEITPKFYRLIKQFAPFGPGNMMPVFKTTNVCDYGDSRKVGNNHLKLSITQEGFKRLKMDGIAFHFGEQYAEIAKGKNNFDICYHVEENEWNGFKNLQLRIKDIKIKKQP